MPRGSQASKSSRLFISVTESHPNGSLGAMSPQCTTWDRMAQAVPARELRGWGLEQLMTDLWGSLLEEEVRVCRHSHRQEVGRVSSGN
mmetsp:Transcript_125596/g.391040  ORF Transcript_125596/g.391040 Transcript_125596/m.391040 type:complete len:88 (+) Transcript_125596:1110-1373(+)